jgi:hypothetical protein
VIGGRSGASAPSFAALGLILALAGPALAVDRPPSPLGLPIACTFGESCFVQQYADRDAGPGSLDYLCGSETYDRHDGLDIRLLSAADAAKGVSVLAPADGIVKAVRDGMADAFVGDAAGRAAVAGRECGNGAVITLGSGWEVQLCHMRQGSLLVRPGDKVARGATIGLVGYSGDVAFAHVHLTLRHDRTTVDPFTGTPTSEKPTCAGGRDATPLWTDDALAALAYRAGATIETGFSTGPVSTGDLERGAPERPAGNSEAIVFFGRFINLRAGDAIDLRLSGPSGDVAATRSPPLDRAKASYVAYAGKKRPPSGWPPGDYIGTASIIRDGRAIEPRSATFTVAP